VPKGTRDRFWDITEGQTEDADIQWKVHRPMAMAVQARSALRRKR
jgi:hypothetical protein